MPESILNRLAVTPMTLKCGLSVTLMSRCVAQRSLETLSRMKLYPEGVSRLANASAST